ncbi:hypothetical protein SAMN05660199_00421 [Klenkia soli]|uniref:Uncharacterized protein n=2 Tax=Klenkia soli TaxID=1052260 RepID=A0A1H0CVC5_9ACTN|nr:hypothetical protein SAMN05660199_00421 [Klenkia soli]
MQTDPTSDRQTTEQFGTGPRDTAVLPDDRADERAQTHGTATWAAAPVTKPAARRSPDLVALVAGVVFCLIAVLGLVGTSLPGWVFGGGLVAVVLVVIGVGVLVAELRRSRS